MLAGYAVFYPIFYMIFFIVNRYDLGGVKMKKCKKAMVFFAMLCMLFSLMPSMAFAEDPPQVASPQDWPIYDPTQEVFPGEDTLYQEMILNPKLIDNWVTIFNMHPLVFGSTTIPLDPVACKTNLRYASKPQDALAYFGSTDENIFPLDKTGTTYYTFTGTEDLSANTAYRNILIFYDFKVEMLPDDFKTSTEGIKIGDPIPEGVIVAYNAGDTSRSTFTNPNLDPVTISKAYSYEKSQEVKHETSTKFSDSFSISTALTINFPLGAGSVQTTFGWNWGRENSWTDSTSNVSRQNVTDTISVPLPANTSVIIEQQASDVSVAVPYEGKARITYKVKNIHQIKWIFVPTPYTEIASFGDSIQAISDLKHRVEERNIDGHDPDNIDWNTVLGVTSQPAIGTLVPIDNPSEDQTARLEAFNSLTQSQPYTPLGGTFTYKITGNNITPFPVEPLYNLDRIVPSISNIAMKSSDSYYLKDISLQALNRYNVPYYGFNSRTEGAWEVVKVESAQDGSYTTSPDNTIATLKDSINGKMLVPVKAGTTYIQYITKAMSNVETTLNDTDNIGYIKSQPVKVVISESGTPNNGGGGGGGGGGSSIVIPEVQVPAATAIIPRELRFNIGQINSYFVPESGVEEMMLMDAAPMLYMGRTLLPIKFLVEPLGGTVAWDQPSKKITITQGTNTIEIWIGNNIAKVNGASVLIDSDNLKISPIIVSPGRAMLPLRFIAETLGYNVTWNQELKQVVVSPK